MLNVLNAIMPFFFVNTNFRGRLHTSIVNMHYMDVFDHCTCILHLLQHLFHCSHLTIFNAKTFCVNGPHCVNPCHHWVNVLTTFMLKFHLTGVQLRFIDAILM